VEFARMIERPELIPGQKEDEDDYLDVVRRDKIIGN
jgi:hypothetical protein